MRGAATSRIAAACAACAACAASAACAGCGDGEPATGCERPALDGDWLRPFLAGAVAELAAAPRATPQERDAARALLLRRLAELGWATELKPYPGGLNVLAAIPATVPAAGGGAPADAPLIVLGAHFDTVAGSPGASDNASGVAAVLAVARHLQDVPCRAADVAIALFDQEEVGLLGSRAFAATLEPARVRAVHTLDQIAWDADGDRRFELELPAPALEADWRAAAAAVGARVQITSTSGTDHASFRERGLPAAGLTEEYVGGDTSPFRHMPGDTPESIAPYLDYLALASQLTAYVVTEEVCALTSSRRSE